MPTGAVLVVRLQQRPAWGAPNRWRRDLLTAFDPDDFTYDGPLRIVRNSSDGPVPVADKSIWVDVVVSGSYYGEGYERGDLPYFARLAEWLEENIPECEVWYGHDCGDESIKPFGPTERQVQMAYFNQVGHARYDARRPKFGGT